MTDPEQRMVNVQLQWSDINLALVDQIVGYTVLEGIARIAIGQLTFVPNSPAPVARPVVMIGATKIALERMQVQLSEIIRSMESDESAIGTPVHTPYE